MKTQKKFIFTGSALVLVMLAMVYSFVVKAAEPEKEVQTVEAEVRAYGYPDITVEANQSVRINFKVAAADLNACNNEINIPEWNITKKLSVGDNYVEFTPTETGTFSYSCWMGMLGAKITVIEPGFGDAGAAAPVEGYAGFGAGGCGMGGSGFGGSGCGMTGSGSIRNYSNNSSSVSGFSCH